MAKQNDNQLDAFLRASFEGAEMEVPSWNEFSAAANKSERKFALFINFLAGLFLSFSLIFLYANSSSLDTRSSLANNVDTKAFEEIESVDNGSSIVASQSSPNKAFVDPVVSQRKAHAKPASNTLEEPLIEKNKNLSAGLLESKIPSGNTSHAEKSPEQALLLASLSDDQKIAPLNGKEHFTNKGIGPENDQAGKASGNTKHEELNSQSNKSKINNGFNKQNTRSSSEPMRDKHPEIESNAKYSENSDLNGEFIVESNSKTDVSDAEQIPDRLTNKSSSEGYQHRAFEDEKDSLKMKSPLNGFAIGLFIEPSLQWAANDNSKHLARHRDFSAHNAGDMNIGLHAGMSISYKLFSGISLSSGINYVSFSETISYEHVQSDIPVWDNQSATISYLEDPDPTSVSYNGTNKISYLEIPLAISFGHKLNENQNIIYQFGLSYRRRLLAQGQTLNPFDLGLLSLDNVRSTSFAYLMGMGYERSIHEHLALYSMASFRSLIGTSLSIEPVSNLGNAEFKPQSVGLQIGIKYKL